MRETAPEADGGLCLAVLDPRFRSGRGGQDLSDTQVFVAVDMAYHFADERVGSIPDDIYHRIVDFRADGESEEDDLDDRHDEDYQSRPLVPEDVPEFFSYECCNLFHYSRSALPAIFVNTSSMSRASKLSFNSFGVPRASILPSTMIDTRSQYSASSI